MPNPPILEAGPIVSIHLFRHIKVRMSQHSREVTGQTRLDFGKSILAVSGLGAATLAVSRANGELHLSTFHNISHVMTSIASLYTNSLRNMTSD